MAIPSMENLMKQVIGLMADGRLRERKTIISEVRRRLLENGEVSEEEANETLQKSGQNKLNNAISWAVSHLYKADLLERVDRARYIISDKGRETHQRGIKLTFEYLKSIPKYSEWLSNIYSSDKGKKGDLTEYRLREAPYIEEKSIEERLELIAKEAHDNLKKDLLDILRQIEFYKFEKILLELLKKMGYGEPRITSRTRDDGIDGVVMADKFGFDEVYIQAKRWNNKVGADVITNFIGALARKGASSGVVITTSDFTDEARRAAEEVKGGRTKIVLINGDKLANLMIEYDVGVYVKYTYEIKAIDENFFEEV